MGHYTRHPKLRIAHLCPSLKLTSVRRDPRFGKLGLIEKASAIHENEGVKKGSALALGWMELCAEYRDEYLEECAKELRSSEDVDTIIGTNMGDFVSHVEKIKELVRVAFNRESDRAKGTCKVKASQLLGIALTMRSHGEYCGDLLKRWGNGKVMQMGGRTWCLKDLIEDKGTRQFYDYLTEQYELAGFVLKSERKLAQDAYRWYQCRVVHSGPKEFTDWLRNKEKEPEDVDPANVSTAIRDYDEAMGYQRESRKRRKPG